VRRTLSAEELSNEASVPIDRIEWLVRIGIIKPRAPGRFGAGDLFRARMITALLDAGFSQEQIEWAVDEGNLNLDHVDRYMLVDLAHRSRSSFAEFTSEIAASPSLLAAVYQVLGLPEPDPSSGIDLQEEALLEQFLRAWRLAPDDETVIRAARLLGEGTRLAVTGSMELFRDQIAAPAQERFFKERLERFPPDVSRTSTLLIRLLPRMMTWLTQRYFEQVLVAGIVSGFESILASRGLAAPPQPSPPTVVFADVSGYTRLTDERGDEVAVRIASSLQRKAEAAATAHGGRLVKLLGDGAMLSFPDSRRGVRAALELVRTLTAETDVAAHAGAHVGPVIERDRDLFGGTVNMASRIAERAGPGEVIVSEAVVRDAADDGVGFDPVGETSLKGFVEPVPLFRAHIL